LPIVVLLVHNYILKVHQGRTSSPGQVGHPLSATQWNAFNAEEVRLLYSRTVKRCKSAIDCCLYFYLYFIGIWRTNVFIII